MSSPASPDKGISNSKGRVPTRVSGEGYEAGKKNRKLTSVPNREGLL